MAKRSTRERQRFKMLVLERDGRCLACGLYLDEWTVNPHHIITKGAGGDDSPENGVALCQECHVAVHNGQITPATLRWMLKMTYDYGYDEFLLGDRRDRLQAGDLMTTYTLKARPIW